MEIRPLLLVQGQNVSVKFDNAAKEIAEVQSFGTKGYQIIINRRLAEQHLALSWLHKRISMNDFLIGLIVHEVSHIKYGTFLNKADVINSNLFHTIDNIIEDARVEYALTLENPAYVKYIRWLLASIKVTLKNGYTGEQITKTKAMVLALYKLVRFGIIDKQASPEFISFCLPLVLSATRGDRKNSVRCVRAIYDYISESGLETSTKMEQSPMGKREAEQIAEEIEEAEGNDDKVTSSGVAELIEESTKDAKPFEQSALGASGEANELIVEEKDSSFYRATITHHAEEIDRLREVFKRMFESAMVVKDFDGDLNIMRQQEAYLDSLTGENTAPNYQRLKLREAGLDVVILRDVSGSTGDFKDQYAQATIIMLAALEGLKSVNTSLVDFSNSAVLVKELKAKLSEARLFPRAEGGTDLVDALIKLEGMRNGLNAQTKLGFILTDGCVNDPALAAKKKLEISKTMGVEFHELMIIPHTQGFNNGKINGYGQTQTTVDKLPETVSEMIVRRLGK